MLNKTSSLHSHDPPSFKVDRLPCCVSEQDRVPRVRTSSLPAIYIAGIRFLEKSGEPLFLAATAALAFVQPFLSSTSSFCPSFCLSRLSRFSSYSLAEKLITLPCSMSFFFCRNSSSSSCCIIRHAIELFACATYSRQHIAHGQQRLGVGRYIVQNRAAHSASA